MLYKYILDILDKKKISLKETLLLIMNFHISVYVIVIFTTIKQIKKIFSMSKEFDYS